MLYDVLSGDNINEKYPCKTQTILSRLAYHSNIKGLGHHRNEHVEEQNSGRNIVKTEQKLSKAFDIAQFNFEHD